jgi:hypothetical protein
MAPPLVFHLTGFVVGATMLAVAGCVWMRYSAGPDSRPVL